MWRACHDLLTPKGRVAGYVIHTPPGLSQYDIHRATELGPSEVAAPDLPAAQAEANGFKVLIDKDVTTDFAATCDALLQARDDLAAELLQEEGPEVFEEERLKKLHMLEGIRGGLLLRSLLVVQKGDAEDPGRSRRQGSLGSRQPRSGGW